MIHHIYWNSPAEILLGLLSFGEELCLSTVASSKRTIWQKTISCLKFTTFLHLWKQINKKVHFLPNLLRMLSPDLSPRSQFSHAFSTLPRGSWPVLPKMGVKPLRGIVMSPGCLMIKSERIQSNSPWELFLEDDSMSH